MYRFPFPQFQVRSIKSPKSRSRRESKSLRAHIVELSNRNVDFPSLPPRRLLQIEVSYKYTRGEALSLFHLAGLRLIQTWTDSSHRHSVYLVEKPFVFFPSLTAAKHLGIEQSTIEKNDCGVPALEEWEEMFRAWDWLMVRPECSVHPLFE